MLLIEAVQQGRTKQVRLLIKVGIDVNRTDRLGQTALIHSCFVQESKQRQMAIKTLVANGSDINKRDNFGRSVLSWACLYGREDVVDFLLNSPKCFDIEVDITDKDGNSTLLLAVMSGSFPVVKLILEALKETKSVFQLHRANNAGISPLVLAFLRGDKRCAEFLVREGTAPVSNVLQYLKRPDNQGSLPVGFTQESGMPERVKSTNTRRQQTLFNLKKITEHDILQFLFAKSKTSSGADKGSANKKGFGEEVNSSLKNRANTSDSSVAGVSNSSDIELVSEHSISCASHSKDIHSKCTAKTICRDSNLWQPSGFSSSQESAISKLFSLYSEIHSPSYRQGLPITRYQPTPEVQEEQNPASLDSKNEGNRSRQGSILMIGDDFPELSKESALDRHLRVKYARSSRAASLQVSRLPPIGLAGLRPGRVKRSRSSTTIKPL